MSKDLTREEFAVYCSKLDFTDFGDMLAFVRAYQDAFAQTPLTNKDEHFDAFTKYMIVMQNFGPMLLSYSEGAYALASMLQKLRSEAPVN